MHRPPSRSQIGAYLAVQFPALDQKHAALGAYLVFVTLNIVGVQIAATFELVVTILAVPSFSSSWALSRRPSAFRASPPAAGPARTSSVPRGSAASSRRLPFAIWFFLAIEGVAMAAEEARDPKRTIPIAYITGVTTLVLLAFGVMIFAGASGDWKALSNLNDPLPQAMKSVVGASSGWLHMLVWLGLFRAARLVPRHHHGVCAADVSRSRVPAIWPRVLSRINPRFRTPDLARSSGGIIGVAAIYSDNLVKIAGQTLTASIVTMSVFGALTMYVMSMLSLFRLRQREPDLPRPYHAPALSVGAGLRARDGGGRARRDDRVQSRDLPHFHDRHRRGGRGGAFAYRELETEVRSAVDAV